MYATAPPMPLPRGLGNPPPQNGTPAWVALVIVGVVVAVFMGTLRPR
jgi:hypothetical protein